MNSSFFNFPVILFLAFILFLSFSAIFPFAAYDNNYINSDYILTFDDSLSSDSMIWPTPGCNTITSYFGYRNRPTLRSFYISFWH